MGPMVNGPLNWPLFNCANSCTYFEAELSPLYTGQLGKYAALLQLCVCSPFIINTSLYFTNCDAFQNITSFNKL